MLFRVLHSRTVRDTALAGAVILAAATGTFFASAWLCHILTGDWAQSWHAAIWVSSVYVLLATAATAIAATPRLVRVVRSLCGRD